MSAAPRISGLELLRPVGRGALGEVWAARDLATGRLVAVKLLPTPGAAARLKREVAAAARLAHPALVPVFAAGEAEDGRPYFTMELIDGETLRERLSSPGAKLDARAAVALVARLARGLEHAHDRGVVHRAVRPESVLLDERGQPRLVDFGLAPEGDRGPEADVQALGELLREALATAGQPGAGGDATLDGVVQRALDPALDRRFPSCRDLALELEAWLAGVPPPPPRSKAGMAIVVGTLIVAILAASCLAILIGFKGEAARLPRDRPVSDEQ